jgi:hypothetical protein
MGGKSSIPMRLLILTIGGAAFAAVTGAAILVPMKLQGLLPSNFGWTRVVAGPLLCFYLLSGAVVTPLISERLGFEPLSLKSVALELAYVGIMVLAIFAIEVCS